VQSDLDLSSYDLIDDLARSFRRGALGVSDRRSPSLSSRDMLTHSSNRGLYFLDCERSPGVFPRGPLFIRWRNIRRSSYTTGCLPAATRAPSPGGLAVDAAMRGESDHIRRVDVWDSHAVPPACSHRPQRVASSSDADASWELSSAGRVYHRPP
jgi:hypothetical protein